MVATIKLLSGLVGSLGLLAQASAEQQLEHSLYDQVRIMALGDSITGDPVSSSLFISYPPTSVY